MKDETGMAAWRAFLTAHARVTELLEAELQHERDLPLSWYDVLLQLSEAEGRKLRMTDLAGAVLLSKSGLTRLVDKMCAAGLVSRAPDESDRRGRWVSLTPAGQARLRAAAPVHLRGVAQHFTSHLSPERAQLLAETLTEIANAARQE
ncbi:MAG: MarR family winged helix-turn-helix transcriptional regulator [Dehalococcoidia bacterium]